MADKNQASNHPEAGGDLRSTLVKRLAVAGVLVAVLLGVLAFFDYLAAPEEPEAPAFTRPVPVPPKKEVTQPVKPAESLPEPPKPEAAPEKPAEPPPGPEVPSQPVPAPAPEIRPETRAPARPAASPVPARPPMAKPVSPAVPAQPELARPVAPAVPEPPQAVKPAVPAPPPEETAAPVARTLPESRPAPRATRPPEAVPQVRQPPAPPRLMKGFLVQAGVFTSVQHAEELHAKLTLNGIPSTLEARVQAGPFKTREEAAAAREKMKALGIEGVLVASPAKR